MSPEVIGTWIGLGGIILTVFLQTIFFAFFMGKLYETVNSVKRRLDALENRPIINHEAKLSAIEATMNGMKENIEHFEERIDERFKGLEGTFRNMVQLATSSARGRIRDPG